MRIPSLPKLRVPGAVAIRIGCILLVLAFAAPFAICWAEGPGPAAPASSQPEAGASQQPAAGASQQPAGGASQQPDAGASQPASSSAQPAAGSAGSASDAAAQALPGAVLAPDSPAPAPGPAGPSGPGSADASEAGRIIVVYDDADCSADESARIIGSAEESLRARGIRLIKTLATPNGYSGTVVLARPGDGSSVDDALHGLDGAPGIDCAFEDVRIDPPLEPLPPAAPAVPNGPYADADSPLTLPNDPYCREQGGKHEYYAWQTKTVDAWQLEHCDSTVTVALLDSGCQMNHEDLQGVLNKDLAWDVSTNSKLADRPEEVQDTNPKGHGTCVAGIIGAQANNAKGIAGLSYNAKVLPVKITADNNSSRARFIVDGLDYLKRKIDDGELTDLRVVNISYAWGVDSFEDDWSRLTRNAIKALRDRGVLTVCAGGNTGGEGLIMPSDAPEAIGVTAVDRFGKYLGFSSYNKYKDIAAPGNFLFTTNKGDPRAYRYFDGTSGASPVVAGIAALMFAADPSLTVDDAVSIMRSTSQPITDTSHPTDGSAGIIDAYAAVKQVKPVSIADCSIDPIPDQRYTGSAIEPTPVVRNPDGEILQEGVHYTLSYAENRFAGTATLTVTGTGGGQRPFYVGTRTETFSILPTMGNLVLLARFAGDATGDGASGMNAPDADSATFPTRWDHAMAQYNAVDGSSGVPASLRTYLAAATAGAQDLLSAFPQTRPAGGVSYLTLARTREDYAALGDEALVSDALSALAAQYPAYDAAALDGDGDGVLDNLTILASTAAAAPAGDPLRPHAGTVSSGDLSAGGKRVESYMVVDTASLDASPVGAAAHALLGRLGAPDLGRPADRPGTPVGVWDASSDPASPASLPLAVTRSTLGWAELPEKTASGTYTLSALGTGGEQAFSFRYPGSKSEYFVVEYRKKAADPAGLDGSIGGSGLIVYRVNPQRHQEGNLGDADYAYVFRPGETSAGAAQGDVTHAQIAPGGALRSEAGSQDLSQSAADGALCYEDGRNSGAVIRTTGQTDDSVTFELTLPSVGDEKPGGSIISASVPSSLSFEMLLNSDKRFESIEPVGTPAIVNRGDTALTASVSSVRDATAPASLLDKVTMRLNAQSLSEGSGLGLLLGSVPATGGVLPLVLSGSSDGSQAIPEGAYRIETTVTLSCP